MNAYRRDAVLSLIPKDKKTLIDIGCGSGELALSIKNLGLNITGADILDKSSDYFDNYIKIDLSSNSWADSINNKFDVVIASEVIEHIVDPNIFIGNIKKILNRDGVLIITTPNFLFWKNRFKILFGKFKYTDSGLMDFGHIRFFTPEYLADVINKNGGEIIKRKDFFPNLCKRNLNWLGKKFKSFFAYQMISSVKFKDNE